MSSLVQCPHCEADLPPVQDAFCPECGEELIPDREAETPPSLKYQAVEVPILPRRTAEVAPKEQPAAPESNFAGWSLFLSLFLAGMLMASLELFSHERLAARHGNGPVILALFILAGVIHLVRIFSGGDRHGTGFGIACFILVIALYTHYDEKWFAARRPWNLFLAALMLSGGAVVVTGYVLCLIRMFEIKSEQAMAKACLGLGVVALGIVLAMGWGWRLLFRDDSPLPEEKKDRHLKLMCAWTGGLVVQLAILGYVWTKARPGQGFIPPVQELAVKVHVDAAGRDAKGPFCRVRIENRADRPLYGIQWAAFADEAGRVKEDRRRLARWAALEPIPVGGHQDLLIYAGLILELNGGEQGVKVVVVRPR